MNHDIVRELMYEIGLDINSDNQIVDQDTGIPLKIDGKALKYSHDNRIRINKDTEIFFNPITNAYLITHLFYTYLYKLEMLDNRYFHSAFVVKGDNRTCAVVIKSEREELQSNFYNNLNIAYIDAIFRLGGKVKNLHSLDYNGNTRGMTGTNGYNSK